MALIVAAIAAAVAAWVVLNRGSGNGQALSRSSTPNSERSEEDQTLVDAVLESPEKFDEAVVESAEPKEEAGAIESVNPAVPACTLPVGKDRHLLSDIEKPPAPQPLKEPVAAESLYFWKDYASLRTDAIRNPDSAENRAGVAALMKTRQRRLGQK